MYPRVLLRQEGSMQSPLSSLEAFPFEAHSSAGILSAPDFYSTLKIIASMGVHSGESRT